MKIYDVTGKIKNGMWCYGDPFPEYDCTPLVQPEWVKAKVWCEVFGGMNSQTGTYLETPAHYLGPEKSYLLEDLPIEKLIDVRVSLIKLDPALFGGKRIAITDGMLKEAANGLDIRPGDALLFSCGWGGRWFDSSYLAESPYLTYSAVEWLTEKKPFILGSDIARWDTVPVSQGFWDLFYNSNILMLAPLVGLENVGTKGLKLTVLPINVADTSCAPCRAFIKEE